MGKAKESQSTTKISNKPKRIRKKIKTQYAKSCSCYVATCKNIKRVNIDDGRRYFFFPRDEKIRGKWIAACQRENPFVPGVHKRICSDHFTPDDYEDKFKADFFNLIPRYLKKTAVPSLNLPEPKVDSISQDSPSTDLQNKAISEHGTVSPPAECLPDQIDEIVFSVTTINDENSELSVGNGCPPVVVDLSSSATPDMSQPVVLEDIEEIKLDLKYMTRQCEELAQCRVKEQKINAELTEKLEVAYQNEAFLKLKVEELNKELNFFHLRSMNKIKDTLKNCFTPTQIEIILNKRNVKWAPEELSRAYTLLNFSKKAYNYLRKTCHYPLPAINTLRRNLSESEHLKNCILGDVIKVLEISATMKNDLQKCCILCYDRVKSNEDILGHHAYMQVVMARGLFESWAHPVFVGYDTKLTRELLLNLIMQLHEISFNVVACVSHCESCNQGIWSECSISKERTYMFHPVTNEKIFFFADARQTLKLLCFNVLDSEFALQNGTIINKEPIKALIEQTNPEISSLHKLSTQHLFPKKLLRGTVEFSAELMSNNTVEALKAYHILNDDKQAFAMSRFIMLVSNWFDVMNSSIRSDSADTIQPFDNNKDQAKILNDMIETMETVTCRGKYLTRVFQKAIIITSKSVQGLYIELKKKYKIDYFLSYRLSHDCIEKFFSRVQSSDEIPPDYQADIKDEMDGYLPIPDEMENTSELDESRSSSPLMPKTEGLSIQTDHNYAKWKVLPEVSANWWNEFKKINQSNTKIGNKILQESFTGMTQGLSNTAQLMAAYGKTRDIIKNSYLKKAEKQLKELKREESDDKVITNKRKTCT